MNGLLAGFTRSEFTDSRGCTYPVLSIGEGPGVLVLHELSGLSETCLRLGKRFADAGMSAHLPLLFGEPGQSSMVKGLRGLFCLRHEFTIFATGRTSPIATWIREAAGHVQARSAGRQVGVVGMCVTGGLALASLTSDAVAAAVASQPSLPVALSCMPGARRRDLGLGAPELNALQERNPPVLALRFCKDCISPPQRLNRLQTVVPAAEVIQVPGRGHAVLTFDLRSEDPEDPTMLALQRVIAFLQEHLGVEAG